MLAQDLELAMRRQFLAKAMDAPSNATLKMLLQDYVAKKDSFSSFDLDTPPGYCSKNCLLIQLNKTSLVLVEAEPTAIKEIRQAVFNFLENAAGEFPLSASLPSIFNNRPRYLSKALVRLVYDSIPQSELRLITVREIVKGIADYRNTLALRYYREDYVNLNSALKAELDGKINNKLVILDFLMVPPPPPEMMEVLVEEEGEDEIDPFQSPEP